MIKKIWLVLLFLFFTTATSYAANLANMVQVQNVRFSYGSGTIRVVLDLTKSAEFIESYAENPSRLVLDIKNAWIGETVPREVVFNSTAAKKMRIAQFDNSTVRVVIESMADVRPFLLPGGPSGHRLVVDVGNAPFKENPELNKPVENSPPVIIDYGKPKDDNKKDSSKTEKKSDKKSDKKSTKKTDKKTDKKSTKKSDKKSDKKTDKKSTKKTEEVKKTPLDIELDEITKLKGKIIAIDPGHGGNDAGAIGPTGVMEKSVTLRVALELEDLLKAEGAEVVMTRRNDRTVAASGAKASDIEELQARCDVANSSNADIFISIHADSFTNPAARGSTGYYYNGSANSQRLADCIRKALCEQLQTPSRGTQPCNFYVVRHTDMPSTLIELAFISNAEEEKLLNSREGIMKAAQGILDGIEDYFG